MAGTRIWRISADGSPDCSGFVPLCVPEGQLVSSGRYIDDVELRMAIEALLNKIELANRFTRAVAVGSPRDFIFALQEDQQVAESCNRLIKNAIVCWNYLYLKMRRRTAEPAMRAEMMLALKTHSPQESMQSCGVHYAANVIALSSFAGRKPG